MMPQEGGFAAYVAEMSRRQRRRETTALIVIVMVLGLLCGVAGVHLVARVQGFGL
jgi:uncharacterized iron-regulated membrane protein